jgi:hypothetical protein
LTLKAIFLATVATFALFAAVTVCFRAFATEHRARQMLVLYLCGLVVLALAWFMTPQSLGVLPPSLQAEPAWVDFLACLFFYSAAFFGGVLQLYNLADRGFSLRIVIDLVEGPEGGSTSDDLIACYGGGKGMAWMYGKRLEGLLANGFIQSAAGTVALTAKGHRTAQIFLALRRFFNLEP